VLDQTDVAAIPAALDQIERDLGPIRVLVNNAAIGNMKPTLEFTEAEFDQMVSINQKGPFFLTQHIGRRLISQADGGRIINIASGAALRVVTNNNLYAMTKAAIVFLTAGLAKEWGPHGINTNCICPGFIDTPLNAPVWETAQGKDILRKLPRGRLGKPEDLADMFGLPRFRRRSTLRKRRSDPSRRWFPALLPVLVPRDAVSRSSGPDEHLAEPVAPREALYVDGESPMFLC